MNRLLMGALMLTVGILSGNAQGLDDIQIHGFATQAFVATNQNNYIGMDTSAFTAAWTEAAININDSVSNRLRVGVQLHYTRLGAFGGDDVSVDWALGDFKINQYLGVRGGKIKQRWGLYNDTQDYDPGYMWSLLPEGIYGIDYRATDLSQEGVEFYGKLPLNRKAGNVTYSAYYGSYFYSMTDGLIEAWKEAGINFSDTPGGKTPGGDLRWDTPVKGLKVGASMMAFDAKGNLAGGGTFYSPYAFWPAGYAQYDFKKVFASWQTTKLVSYQKITVPGAPVSVSGSDARSWFAMGGYRVTDKLEAGGYYTKYTVPSAGDNANPANYFKDWVVSSRYDFNSNFYGKLEGHFINGNAQGFYTFDNPNGLQAKTDLVVAKIGFTF